ncbi:MAG: DUF882 domain-containing protein [Alphaproteobacteria bacterium]|nr:DUF882 domain-containing protein [Alphaproteobacteria bacterium]
MGKTGVTGAAGESLLIGRRKFFAGAAALAAPAIIPSVAQAAIARPKTLKFEHLHTGETLRATFWADGDYVPDALDEINRHLRDHRTGEVYPINPKLMDLLHALRRKLDTGAEFRVISGYRSPKTNAKLASKSGGVARKSLHMKGMAIDIRVPDRSTAQIHKAAKSLKLGGVGAYYKSAFVHVDVGRVRYW